MSKKVLCIAAFVFMCGSAFAQLTESDTMKFGYRFTANGSFITGNVERLLLISSLDLSTVHQKWAIRSSNTYQFGTFGKFRTENDLLSKNFFYFIPKSKIYPYIMSWFETNQRRNFSFRYQIGAGGSLNVISSQHHKLKISLTFTYEQTFYNKSNFVDSKYTGGSVISTARATTRVFGQHHFIKDKLRFRYEIWAQPSFSYLDNYRIHADGFLEVPVSKLISLRSGVNYSYERVVLQGVKQQDIFVVFGLTIANYR